jgi:hypothetical protein
MRRIPLALAAALLAAFSSILSLTARAAEPQSAVPDADDAAEQLGLPAADAEVHLNLIDQKLALSLAVDTHAQIEFADFALKGVANDALRQYLSVRLEGQHAFATRLDTLTGGRTRSAIVRAMREIEDDRAADRSQKTGLRLLSLRNASAMLARIRLEILQEYAQTLRGELSAKSAEEFDRVYLRFELANQMQMLAALRVFENQASDDFALVIHEAWTAAKDELLHARQLLLQLETAPLVDQTAAKPTLTEAITQPPSPQEP